MTVAEAASRGEKMAGDGDGDGGGNWGGGALDLAALLASRLCHDLAGLCGTLTGALELLGEATGADADEAVALSQEAARALARRLRLLRAAWGLTGEPLDAAALAALAEGLPGAPRVRADVSGLAPDLVLAPARGRLVLNALLLGGESLRGAGTIRLAGDARALRLALDGARAGWPERLAAVLADPDAAARNALAEGPRGLQAPLLALLARDAGAAATLVADPAASDPAAFDPSALKPAGAGPALLRLGWAAA